MLLRRRTDTSSCPNLSAGADSPVAIYPATQINLLQSQPELLLIQQQELLQLLRRAPQERPLLQRVPVQLQLGRLPQRLLHRIPASRSPWTHGHRH